MSLRFQSLRVYSCMEKLPRPLRDLINEFNFSPFEVWHVYQTYGLEVALAYYQEAGARTIEWDANHLWSFEEEARRKAVHEATLRLLGRATDDSNPNWFGEEDAELFG